MCYEHNILQLHSLFKIPWCVRSEDLSRQGAEAARPLPVPQIVRVEAVEAAGPSVEAQLRPKLIAIALVSFNFWDISAEFGAGFVAVRKVPFGALLIAPLRFLSKLLEFML